MERTFALYEHQAHYYETDQMGIIHHSNYIRWFEEARTNLLDQMGFGYDQLEKLGIIIPVLAITCTYKSMVYFNDCVYIIPKIEAFNGVRLTVSYQILDKTTGELRTTGESKHCFLDKNNRPISLKKQQPKTYELFDAYLGVDLSN